MVSVIFQMGIVRAEMPTLLNVPAFTSRLETRAWADLKVLEPTWRRFETRAGDVFVQSLDTYRIKDIVKDAGLKGFVHSASLEISLTVLVPESARLRDDNLFSFVTSPQRTGTFDIAELRLGRFFSGASRSVASSKFRSQQITISVPLVIEGGDLSSWRLRLLLRNDLRGYRDLQRKFGLADRLENTLYADGLQFYGAGTFQSAVRRPQRGLHLGSLEARPQGCEASVLAL